MFIKRTNGEWVSFHNYRRSRLDLTYANLKYFWLFLISCLNLMFGGAIKFGDSQMKYAILQYSSFVSDRRDK